MTDNGIASIVRSLAEGVDPGRVLRDVANEALTRSATQHLLLAAMLEGQLTPLVAIGSPHAVLFDAGQEACRTGRPVRRSDPALRLAAVAVPVRRHGGVLASLAVAGAEDRGPRLDTDALAPVADCAALALAAQPPAGLRSAGGADGAAGVALAEALGRVAAATTTDEVLAAALDVAADCFGARAGFACLPSEPGGVEIVAWRGIERERLGAASRHPGFARLIAPGSSPGVTVLAPTDAAVAQLTAGAEFAVCLPVAEGPPGALVLLVGDEPDRAGRRALEALRINVVAGLRAARAAAAVDAAALALSTLTHAVADPVVVVDDAGRFTAVNPAAAELFALSDPFEIGRPAHGRLGHPDLETLLLEDGAAAVEVVVGRPVPRRFLATARTLGRAGGRALVLRAAGRPPAAGPEEADVLAGLGRALRAPLAVITALAAGGPAGAGRGSPADWEVARKAIGAEAARLEAIADQLTLLAADDRTGGRVAIRAERVDVVAAVGTIVAARRAGHPDRLVTLAAPARLDAVVDRRFLERVVDALVDNALRYSDGPVGVEVADRGDTFEVAVVDAGPGIFSGDVPGLFERFHPLDGSPARRSGGLSLYTGRRLAELMGGRLWCDSRLGVGSRFALRLPSACQHGV